jgi:hypothetical protein
MPSDLRFPGIRGPEHEYDPAFDRADRWTGRVARGMAVGIPVWLVLLLVFPLALDVGPMPSLLLSTILAVVITEVVERALLRPLLARRRGETSDGGIARSGRALVIGLIAWGVLIVVFADPHLGDVDNVWVATLVPLGLAIALVEVVERGIVRPWQRRRASRG